MPHINQVNLTVWVPVCRARSCAAGSCTAAASAEGCCLTGGPKHVIALLQVTGVLYAQPGLCRSCHPYLLCAGSVLLLFVPLAAASKLRHHAPCLCICNCIALTAG